MSLIRWGILGCGGIARSFAKGLLELPDARLVAVASSDADRAKTFATEWKAEKAFGRYEDLAKCSEVDVVYIASTHPGHYPHAKLCLEGGRHVLCEKPITMNAAQARSLQKIAQKNQGFLMEAMWTRFIPAVLRLQEMLAQGVIGKVQMLQADFGISNDWAPTHRMVDPAKGGGALLDLGVYPLTFARLIMGADPITIQGQMIPYPATGVDGLGAYLLSYPQGRVALLSSSCTLKTPHEARIFGDKGRIVVPDFFHPQGFTIHRHDTSVAEVEEVKVPFVSTGYQFEAAEVGRCLRAGLKESPKCPMSETIAIMESMDALRKQWGLTYSSEHV